MMIQFNLLPDIKLEYLRARRTKRTVMYVSSVVSLAALLLFIVLVVVVKFSQPAHIKNITADIKQSSNDLKATGDIDKVLTIQNQLNSLTGIHEKKAASTRLLGFVGQFTPENVSINNLDINFAEHIVTITGAAPSLVDVNRYVDTLKFTDYKNGEDKQKAFSEVVLTNFGKSDKGASYTITFKYAEILFDNTKIVELQIPNTISTRSEQEKPKELFEPSTNTSTEGAQ